MRQSRLFPAFVAFFLYALRISEVTAKDGLRREAQNERALESDNGTPAKNSVHLTVANRRHPAQAQVTDSGIGRSGTVGARIIGGDGVDNNEYPYFADLGGCGATLIAPRVLLTAGKFALPAHFHI
jgi:hypothetical protein